MIAELLLLMIHDDGDCGDKGNGDKIMDGDNDDDNEAVVVDDDIHNDDGDSDGGEDRQ